MNYSDKEDEFDQNTYVDINNNRNIWDGCKL